MRPKYATYKPGKPVQIVIYHRASGDIVETQEITNMQAFLYYWASQCDAKTYGWRVAKEHAQT